MSSVADHGGPSIFPMPTGKVSRWYCGFCGIVRDVDAGDAPWCRHNAIDTPAQRMAPIKASHPLATGPLPWGDTDPARSAA